MFDTPCTDDENMMVLLYLEEMLLKVEKNKPCVFSFLDVNMIIVFSERNIVLIAIIGRIDFSARFPIKNNILKIFNSCIIIDYFYGTKGIGQKSEVR